MTRLAETKFWPATEVVLRPIAELKPAARNVRVHSAAQIDQIRGSLRDYGWTTAVLVDEDGTIIAGHGRVEAARLEGHAEVPVAVAVGWTEAQRRAYALADNRIPLNASWDQGALGIELGELSGLGVDLGTLGFDRTELALIPATGGHTGLTDPDAAPEPRALAIATRGDLWAMGRHRLLCGDATFKPDVDRVLAGARPQLMVTDPPYGVDYDPTWRAEAGVNRNREKMGLVANDERADWRDAWAAFPGDVAYVWHAGKFASTVQASLEASGFAIRCQIIWAKDRFALSRGDYHWQHEPCWYAVREKKTGHWAGDRSQSTLWQIPAREDGGHGHGTQKPVECMRRPMLNNSNEDDYVYEPFCGSGTSIIAAVMAGRRCLAIELDPIYVDVAVRRWQEFTGGKATLDGDGRSFDEISAARIATAA